MAYPPAVPPNNRANTTDMVDAHASDHNVIANALTDIIATLTPLVSPAWIAFPFASGFANYGAPYQVCQYRKRGDIVEIRGTWRMNTPAAAANQIVGTLPAGYRPPASVQLTGPQAGTQTVAIVEIGTDGNVKLVGASGSCLGMIFLGYAWSITP